MVVGRIVSVFSFFNSSVQVRKPVSRLWVEMMLRIRQGHSLWHRWCFWILPSPIVSSAAGSSLDAVRIRALLENIQTGKSKHAANKKKISLLLDFAPFVHPLKKKKKWHHQIKITIGFITNICLQLLYAGMHIKAAIWPTKCKQWITVNRRVRDRLNIRKH